MLGGRFVEMTLRAGESWSAVVYIGHERSERRHVLVSLEPGDRRLTTRRGEWVRDCNGLLLTSDQSKATCDVMTPGELRLELAEQSASGQGFVQAQGRLSSGYGCGEAGRKSPPASPICDCLESVASRTSDRVGCGVDHAVRHVEVVRDDRKYERLAAGGLHVAGNRPHVIDRSGLCSDPSLGRRSSRDAATACPSRPATGSVCRNAGAWAGSVRIFCRTRTSASDVT